MSDKALPLAITGAVAVIGLAMATIIFMIHQVTSDVEQMRADVDQLKVSVARLPPLQEGAANMNARINELDSGMLAMAKMLKLDGVELARLMKIDLTVTDRAPAPVAMQAPAIQMKARSTPAVVPTSPTDTPAWAIASESGSSPADQSSSAQLTIDDVDGLLVERISENWNMPPGNIDDLRTELELRLDRDGTMNSVEVITSSGNRIFDDSAVTAIKRINTIPEVALLTDDLYRVGYQSRSIVFTPDLAGQ